MKKKLDTEAWEEELDVDIDLRAFDTSYFLIKSKNKKLLKDIQRELGDEVRSKFKKEMK